MLTSIHESREVPVVGSYDVVVAGGGIAGVAAALAAARAGSRVCLLERYCALGGLATIGNVIIYLPLCDGRGRQVSAGICEEFIRLSVDDVETTLPHLRIEKIPSCWEPGGDPDERLRRRYRTGYNPVTFAYKLERLLLRNRVRILFDTRVCAVDKDGDRIRAVIVENKSGRVALGCQAVVDASGDADVCHVAGEQTVSLRSNVRSGWYYVVEKGEVKLASLTKIPRDDGRRAPESGRNYRGDDGGEVTAMILDSRQFIMEDVARRGAACGGLAYPINVPMLASFRMSRRLVGTRTLRERDCHRWFDDTLGLTGDWRKPGPVYSLPLSILAAVRTPNLITAGRCISAAGRAWDVTRVIPTCAVTGEAAGAAAAALARDGLKGFGDLDVPRLQAYLKRHRVILDPRLVQAPPA